MKRPNVGLFNDVDRPGEVRVIQEIERVAAQLQLQPLGYRDILRKREIQVLEARDRRTAPLPTLPGRMVAPDTGLIGTSANAARFRYCSVSRLPESIAAPPT